MTCPPVWKWKPKFFLHRDPLLGWIFCFYQHTDHNPVIIIQRWAGKWHSEFYKDYFYMRRLRKKYGEF